jgi:predicted XRE-type DNA-binding protein
MIASDIVNEIRRMLAEGNLSQRAIAERTGVSRGTVCAIAHGKRRDCSTQYSQKDKHFITPAGQPVRCSGCGGLVQMPCLACYIRQWRTRRNMAVRSRRQGRG